MLTRRTALVTFCAVAVLAGTASGKTAPPATNETYQPTNAEWLARYYDGQQPIDTLTGGPTNPTSKLERTPKGPVKVGQVLRFDASGSAPRRGNMYGGTAIVNWIWDFGDGVQANAPVVTHAFERPGVYRVNLVVHDDTGWRSSKTDTVEVGAIVTKAVTEELAIPTVNGTVMHGWLTRPAGPGPFPVILQYGPYGTFPPGDGDGYVRSGYAHALVAAPGRELSTGHFDMFGTQTQRGGYDAVEWLARQEWSSGKVGMYGLSGPACAAMLVAASNPPHLAAVVAKSAYSDMYRDIIVAGGVPNSDTFVTAWVPLLLAQDAQGLQATGRGAENVDRARDTAQVLADINTHPFYDDYWRERSITSYPRPKAAVLYYGNQRDLWPRATVEYSRWIGPRGRVISVPGGHAFPDISGWAAGKDGLDFLAGDARLWFDRHLKGIDNGVDHRPRALTFTTYGGEVAAGFNFGRWEALEAFPSRETTLRRFFLRAAGSNGERPTYRGLSAERPVHGEAPGVLLYSPAQGATSDDTAATANQISGLQETWEAQSLVYETPVLERDVRINGPATLTVYATPLAPELAFTAHVNDVYPDGSSHYVSKGALLGTHRAVDGARTITFQDGAERVVVRAYHPHTQETATSLVPGLLYRFDIEIWGVHNAFRAGHRLRVVLAAQDLGWRTHWQPGVAALVHSDAGAPSSLNVMELPAARSRFPFPYTRKWTQRDRAAWS